MIDSINELTQKIDLLLGFVDSVSRMREYQKQYSVYKAISANELSAMVDSIDRVDDFLARRRVDV